MSAKKREPRCPRGASETRVRVLSLGRVRQAGSQGRGGCGARSEEPPVRLRPPAQLLECPRWEVGWDGPSPPRTPRPHPDSRPGAQLAPARPRARLEAPPTRRPAPGKVRATFSGAAGAAGPAGAPPPASSDGPPPPRRTRGSRVAARSPAQAARPSVRAGASAAQCPARRSDPPPRPAATMNSLFRKRNKGKYSPTVRTRR